MNAITQQNIVTESRLTLRSLVYSDNRFIEFFKKNLQIPIFKFEYDDKNFIITLIVDRSACAALSDTYDHKKEFYNPFLHSMLMSSLYDFANAINQPNDVLYTAAPALLIMLNKCLNNEICSYKLFDSTVILDNVINIYL